MILPSRQDHHCRLVGGHSLLAAHKPGRTATPADNQDDYSRFHSHQLTSYWPRRPRPPFSCPLAEHAPGGRLCGDGGFDPLGVAADEGEDDRGATTTGARV